MVALVEQGEVVLLVVGGHEQLERPGAERAVVALDGGGHETPAEGLGERVGRHLPPVEAVGEVPQGLLAVGRLVHAVERAR